MMTFCGRINAFSSHVSSLSDFVHFLFIKHIAINNILSDRTPSL